MNENGTLSVPGGISGLTWLVELCAALVLIAILIPIVMKPSTARAQNTCTANLRKIQSAKASWALATQKLQTDIPAHNDIFGDGKYIRELPLCPQGGVYSLGAVGSNATCSYAEHAL